MSMIINEKQMVVRAIALRYWELSGVVSSNSVDIIKEALQLIKPKENSVIDLNSDIENIKKLTTIINHLLVVKEPQDYSMFIQSLRLSIRDDSELLSVALDSVKPKDDVREIETQCRSYLRYITNYLEKEKMITDLRKLVSNKLYGGEEFSTLEFAREITSTIAPYTINNDLDNVNILDSNILTGGFMSSDPTSIDNQLTITQENVDPEAILKTGYAGLNRMLGKQGGFFRGDTVVIGALQHNYKSGTINDLFVDFCVNNKPYFFNKENKKACFIKISTENLISDDIVRMYQRVMAHTHGIKIDLDYILNQPVERMRDEIVSYIDVNGFEIIHVRMNSSEVSYMDVIDFVDNIRRRGYEVHAVLLDYLITLNPKGIRVKGDGTEYQEMYRLMRNYFSEHYITFFTPHQLSTDATYLNRDDIGADFVNQIVGRSYYAKSKQIDREIDVEIIQHLFRKKDPVTSKTVTYLTMAIGKNRRVHDTPEEHKSFAMPFTELGLMSDVGEGKRPTHIALSTLKKTGAMLEEESMW